MLNILVFIGPYIQTVHAQPSIIDSSLNVKAVVEGLSSPTSMIFLDDNNMLILEKMDKFVLSQMESYKNNRCCKYQLVQKVKEDCWE